MPARIDTHRIAKDGVFEPVCNDDTARFLRALEDWRNDIDIVEEREPPAHDEISEAALATLRVGPLTTIAEIERVCAMWSTPEFEVIARVESVAGRPVVSFHRETVGSIPPYLRKSA